MKVLLTGHDGYIGAVMQPMLEAAGHQVVGLDSQLFAGCDFGPPARPLGGPRVDVRDVPAEALRGSQAVIHLAAISNDPLGDLNPDCTYEINHKDEGYYVVLEIVTEASNLDDVDRFLRLADETVRHKAIRLPDAEAERRGLLGEASEPAAAG